MRRAFPIVVLALIALVVIAVASTDPASRSSAPSRRWIVTAVEGVGAGDEQVRTTYRVAYWDHGRRQEVREPE